MRYEGCIRGCNQALAAAGQRHNCGRRGGGGGSIASNSTASRQRLGAPPSRQTKHVRTGDTAWPNVPLVAVPPPLPFNSSGGAPPCHRHSQYSLSLSTVLTSSSSARATAENSQPAWSAESAASFWALRTGGGGERRCSGCPEGHALHLNPCPAACRRRRLGGWVKHPIWV